MAEFKPNRSGYADLLKGGQLLPALHVQASQIESRAKASARVESAESAAAHNRTPGKFRSSIHTEVHRGPTRTTVQVVADCEGAAAIEARDHTLGQAAG